MRGLLVAGLAPVALGTSPLVDSVTASPAEPAVVRGATQVTALGGWLAGAAVAALLALGAARELHGRLRWRRLQSRA